MSQKLPKTTKDLQLISQNLNITDYRQPGIFMILNQQIPSVYIQETDNLLYRIGQVFDSLNASKPFSNLSLQDDFDKFKISSFQCIILECGPQWKEFAKRDVFERGYKFLFANKGFLIYNLESQYSAIKKPIDPVKCEQVIDDYSLLPLTPLNENVSFLLQPGLYCFNHKTNFSKYIGEANIIVARLYTNISSLYSIKNIFSFQKDWLMGGLDAFEIYVLDYGPIYLEKPARVQVEILYFNVYQKDVYNTAVYLQDEESTKPELKDVDPDIKGCPVYYKDRYFSSIDNMTDLLGKGKNKILSLLNDFESPEYAYGRSYYRFRGRITKLFVKDLETVYLNGHLAAVSEKTTFKKVNAQAKENKTNSTFRYLEDLSSAEKQKIPNLKGQLWREIRKAINLPLNLKDPRELEIYNTQTPTYDKSTKDNITFDEVSINQKTSIYKELDKLVNKNL